MSVKPTENVPQPSQAPRWAAPSPLPPAARTERLEVRLYREGDAQSLFSAVASSREALLPWMKWAQTRMRTEEECQEYVADQLAAYADPANNDFAMGIFSREEGVVVGGTGLHRIRPEVGEAEIGYWIAASHRGTGLCTESTGALISAALRPRTEGGWGLRRIIISCAALNLGSVRVCEKLALRRESVRKQDRWFAGSSSAPAGFIDSHTYAVLASEWDGTRSQVYPHLLEVAQG